MIKKLLFNLFRKDFVRFAYEGVHHKQTMDLSRLEFAFFDQEGLAYYSFKEDKQPILRKMNTAIAYVKLVNGISELDISESLRFIHAAIHEQDAKGKMIPNIAKIGFICTQLLSRQGRLIVPDHLHELAANYFIREDENIDLVSDEILQEKLGAIKELPIDILRKFFFSKQLNEIFPLANQSEEFFAQILKEGEIETMAYLKVIKDDHAEHNR